jgi:hypothetical protein
VTDLSRLNFVRLCDAQLCLNSECEHISNATGDTCPACGCVGLVHVARFLNAYPRMQWPKPAGEAGNEMLQC